MIQVPGLICIFLTSTDTTAAIGAAWYGAVYGFKNVLLKNLEGLEYKERLIKIGESLYDMSH